MNEDIMSESFDFQDGQGPIPARRHPNGGGWVAGTAIVSDTAYIGPDARVFDRARVFGRARVSGRARVFGDAQVSGRAWVSDRAQVSGRAQVFGRAWVFGDARVFGRAWVFGRAQVFGDAWTWGDEPEVAREDAIRLLDRIREQVANEPASLKMANWHCGTSHCVAGWAQVLATGREDGAACYADGIRLLGRWGAPMFFESDERVRDWLASRTYAGEDGAK